MQKETSQLAIIIRALEDIQANDIVTIDVSKRTSVTDYMIICNGRASRHVKAIAEHVIPVAKANGMPALHTSGMENAEWVLIDLGDFVIHIMQPERRAFYNLETFWQSSTARTDEAIHQ